MGNLLLKYCERGSLHYRTVTSEVRSHSLLSHKARDKVRLLTELNHRVLYTYMYLAISLHNQTRCSQQVNEHLITYSMHRIAAIAVLPSGLVVKFTLMAVLSTSLSTATTCSL